MQTNLVVGAGRAGTYAAVAMRRAGFAGRIVLIGAEQDMPYDRPPLSKEFLALKEQQPPTPFFEPAVYETANIELALGVTVDAVDPGAARVHLSNGRALPYEALILATGSRPRRLGIPGEKRSVTLRTLADAAELRQGMGAGKRVVCIGAGVIGLEVASSARARGCAVTVIDSASSVMSRSLDRQLAARVEDLHRSHAVDLRLDESIEAMSPRAVVLGSGEEISAEVVIAGIGIERNVQLAQSAGLTTGNGILVDSQGRTGVPGIYAAGDVAEFYSPRLGRHLALESWKHAHDHGALVGRVVAGIAEDYDPVPWFWSDQHGANIQVAGQTLDPQILRSVDRVHANGSFSRFHLDRRNRVVGAVGINSGKDVQGAMRLIARGTIVDPDVLSDTAQSLQRVVSAPHVTQKV
jgi:NADPH-dependent 2,4-dienoyl-CoA reductase/sulfur reductase-like enzyme